MNAQRALTVVALAAGALAGAVYYLSAQRVPAVVAAADLVPGRAISAADVEVRAFPADAVPAGALAEPAAVVGRYVRAPIWRGQLVLAAGVVAAPAAFGSGIALPTGYRAVAIPVGAANAVGGAILPGARVDVIAVPLPGRAPAGRATELIVRSALVVDVRDEQGGALERGRPSKSVAVRERLGSVVIAVAPNAQMWIADRIATSTFVIALVHDGS